LQNASLLQPWKLKLADPGDVSCNGTRDAPDFAMGTGIYAAIGRLPTRELEIPQRRTGMRCERWLRASF